MKAIWTKDIQSTTYKDALTIRYKVFVEEQKVPSDLEIDELEDSSLHVVFYEANEPIATARIYQLDLQVFKVQRVAVLEQYRAKKIGIKLMNVIEKKAKELQAAELTLGSQNTAIPFYEKLGYEISSDEFMDAGIPHHTMRKSIL